MHGAAEISVVHAPSETRFEAHVEGSLCVLDYRLQDRRMIIPSVRVPTAVEGRGIASALTRAALDWARAQALQVEPLCPYVAAWLRRHPDYADLTRGTPPLAP
jgi:predicted GNAT family acetyltransferase